MPLLDKYLSAASAASNVDYEEEMKSLARKMVSKPERQQGLSLDTENPLTRLKLRIIQVLGSLGGSRNHQLVTSSLAPYISNNSKLKSAISYDVLPPWVAWDMQDHLKFAVPFLEMKPEIQLDPLLRRVIELALSSGDRQTRVSCYLPVLLSISLSCCCCRSSHFGSGVK